MQVATQSTSEPQINQINTWMRSQPWYRQFFQAHGLNPNQVRLSDPQRHELETLAARNGVQFGDRMKIDEAGNVNQQGGFAGMPTWAKIAIAAAPAAATMGFGAAGMGPAAGMFGAGGGGGAAASIGAPAATEAGIFGGAGAATGNAAAAGMVGGGAAAASKIPWGTIAKVGGAVAAPLVGRAIAGSGSSNGSNGANGAGVNIPPELQQLLQMQLQRIQSAQPNYDMMLNMARGLQPQWAQQGSSQGSNPQMADIIQRLAQPRG